MRDFELSHLKVGDTVIYKAGQGDYRVEGIATVDEKPGTTGVYVVINKIVRKGSSAVTEEGQRIIAGVNELSPFDPIYFQGDPEFHWQAFVHSAFKSANLPEVDRADLEVGTYTNAEIAEKFRGDPTKLMLLLMKVSNMGGSPASLRQILSFAIDSMVQE